MSRHGLIEKLRRYVAWAGLPPDKRPPHTGVKLKVGVPYLKAALEKEQKGTYGVCEDCGQRIDQRRLDTVPGAIRCANCQREFEESQ